MTVPEELTRGPLSFGQEQLWFLDQMAPGETTYNIMLAWRFHGPLNVDLLRRSLTAVVERHEALRVTIHATDGTPYQVVSAATDVNLEVIDYTELPTAEAREQAVQVRIREQTVQAFDLEVGPLYRFLLLRLAHDDSVLIQGYHHIVTDGWSSAIINAEITSTYQSLVDGTEPEFEEASAYTAFASAQRDGLQGEALEEELKFWEDKLGNLPVLDLQSDRPRPSTSNHRGDTVIRALPEGLLSRANALAQERGASLFMVLAAAVNVVLSRYSGQEDIPLGVPMLGRIEPELEEVVGLFINMVVLRSDLSGDPTFEELLERTADENLDLYEHQEVPFNKVVERIQPQREPGRNPLFQVSVQLLGAATSGDNLAFPGATSEYVLVPSVSSRFDISLNFIESPDALKVSVEYSSDLFDKWRIEAMLGHIETVLAAAAEDPSLRISELPILTLAEHHELNCVSRGEVVPYSDSPLHVTVAQIAAATPDAVAVVCRGVELTYAEFDRRADRFARYLRLRGLQRDQVVAVVIDRDLDAYVAMLGILKAGGTFAMMDPKVPASRLDFMIRDTDTPIVVTRSTVTDNLPDVASRHTVLIDSDWGAVETVSVDGPLEEWASPDTLAYILYTSGSTGTPKGVMIAHRAVSFFAEGFRRTYDFTERDRLLQLPALNFDMSQGEMWTAFSVGGTVVAVAPEDAQSPEALATLMREQRVTYAGLPPAMQSVLEAEPYPELKYIMGGAEVIQPELVNKWNLEGRTYVNLYGPTEAAVACTEYHLEHTTCTSPPPIGRPHVNRQLYVVDRNQNLVPKGVPGELLIGGEDGGLASGYLNQPEMSAKKFTKDPFDETRTVYRSGDLVRWNKDAQLEFVGRVDNQVKLRGLRIELGEIETALQSHRAVTRAVVLMRPDKHGENRLVGYLTTEGDGVEVAELRRHLEASLPDYMMPTAWVFLDEFPLSSGWKINHKALPEPVEDGSGGVYVAPRTPTEEAVARIFADVLSLDQVSAEDSFFWIGGDSLQAMRVVSRVNKAFGIKISIRLLYGNATVDAIATIIDEKVEEKANG